uniref:LAGLIDADG homing endonuclease n=1 Tax=Romanomermis culicivorax TaxID=13658 RepID=A0A915IQM5_ROMCU
MPIKIEDNIFSRKGRVSRDIQNSPNAGQISSGSGLNALEGQITKGKAKFKWISRSERSFILAFFDGTERNR